MEIEKMIGMLVSCDGLITYMSKMIEVSFRNIKMIKKMNALI